jgi:hypothetical protein
MYTIAVVEARVPYDVTFPASNDHAFSQGEDYQGNVTLLFGGCPVMISLHPTLYSSRALGGLRRRRFIRRGSLELKGETLIRESRQESRKWVLRTATGLRQLLRVSRPAVAI